MSDTMMRQWMMLRLVPRSPSKIDTTSLVQALAAEGFKVTQRTVQRDLEKFVSIFPLVCDRRSKPFGWSWSKDSGALDIPCMDSHTALTFYLAEQYLKPMLPQETVGHLSPHFKTARQVLNRVQSDIGPSRWADKVRVVRHGPDLAVPEVLEDVQNAVYSGLLLNRRLQVTYKSRGSKAAKDYTISPLGLVLKNGIFYLPCTVDDYQDVRLLTMHRILSAKKLDNIPSTTPEGFDLDTYIASGHLSFHMGDKIKFEAIITEDVAFHLSERKLSPDQVLQSQDHGLFLVRATVNNTADFRFWLRGYAEMVEVLEPKFLREDMYQGAKALVRQYERGAD